MSACCVSGCNNGVSYDKSEHKSVAKPIKFFRFTQNTELISKWKEVLFGSTECQLDANSKVCELHFQESDIIKQKIWKLHDGILSIIDCNKYKLQDGAIPISLKTNAISSDSQVSLKSVDSTGKAVPIMFETKSTPKRDSKGRFVSDHSYAVQIASTYSLSKSKNNTNQMASNNSNYEEDPLNITSQNDEHLLVTIKNEEDSNVDPFHGIDCSPDNIEQVFIKNDECLSINSDDDASINSLDEIEEIEKNTSLYQLPEKSKRLYMAAYNAFKKWQKEKNTSSYNEDTLLTYFDELSQRYAPSSLWATFSMLKFTLNTCDLVDISVYRKLILFLKQKCIGYRSKKSQVFSKENILKFLKEAPDVVYLLEKVTLIFGIAGALRRDEFVNIKVQDVRRLGEDILFIKVTKRKSHAQRTFTITDALHDICVKYMKTRPKVCAVDRFFLRYTKGKCVQQPIGINKFGGMPKEIASYLNLPDANEFNGHSFRRTSVNVLAEVNNDLTELQKNERSKSKDDNSNSKKKRFNQITRGIELNINKQVKTTNVPNVSVNSNNSTSTPEIVILTPMKVVNVRSVENINAVSENSTCETSKSNVEIEQSPKKLHTNEQLATDILPRPESIVQSHTLLDTEDANSSTADSDPLSTSVGFEPVNFNFDNQRKNSLASHHQITLPKPWSICGTGQTDTYVFTYPVNNDGAYMFEKTVILKTSGELSYQVYSAKIDITGIKLPENLNDISMLPEILKKFKDFRICKGLMVDESNFVPTDTFVKDFDNSTNWRHVECKILSINSSRCDVCMKHYRLISQKVKRAKKRTLDEYNQISENG